MTVAKDICIALTTCRYCACFTQAYSISEALQEESIEKEIRLRIRVQDCLIPSR